MTGMAGLSFGAPAVFLKSTVLPWESVHRPSSRIWRRRLKTWTGSKSQRKVLLDLTWLDLTLRYLCLESRESGLLGLYSKAWRNMQNAAASCNIPLHYEISNNTWAEPHQGGLSLACWLHWPLSQKTGRSFIAIAMIPASTYYFDRLVCNLPNHKKQSQHSI